MRLIDAHIHLFEIMKGFGYLGDCRPVGKGRVVYDTGRERQRFPAQFGDLGVSAERFLPFMDANGIEKAVVMQGPGYGYQNQYLSEVQEKYPNRFLAAAFVDPEILCFDEVLENLTANLKLRFFKLELSSIAGLTGCHARLDTFDSPNLHKLLATAQQMRSTLALDIGGPGEESYQVDKVAELAKAYPELRFVMCHLLEPAPDADEQLAKNLRKMRLPNVWFDISSLPTILGEPEPHAMCRRYLQLGKEIVGAERMIWGSDAPGCLVEQDYQTMLRLLVSENSTFSEREKRCVLYENALQAYPF